MSYLSTIDSLYRVVLLTGLILSAILLYNNLVLYRRKLTDSLSLMLLSVTVMCLFEIVWEVCDGHLELSVFSYIGACGYAISFLLFGAMFNYFFLEQFELAPQRRWQINLFYVAPIGIFSLLCLTTPWTRLLFWVDQNGILQEMILFSTLFYGILMAYLLGALLPAFYYAFIARHKNPLRAKMAESMIVFGIMGPAFFVLQMVVLGDSNSDYLALSPACILALVYLSTNVNTHLLMETQAKVEAAQADLRIASKIQMNALPSPAPEFESHPEIRLRAAMNTAREVGGDFYDYFAIGDDKLCFVIADVSGKGTPAALFMMTVKTMIRDYALTKGSTAEIFDEVNQRLCENNKEGMFATAWIGILDTRTKILQYTNAGHNYPLITRGEKPCERLKKNHGLFLGGLDDTIYGQSEMQLGKGDRLLLYTDGVTEAHNPEGKLYGLERLAGVLDETPSESGEDVLVHIIKDVSAFSNGSPQFDDMTMMLLTMAGEGR